MIKLYVNIENNRYHILLKMFGNFLIPNVMYYYVYTIYWSIILQQHHKMAVVKQMPVMVLLSDNPGSKKHIEDFEEGFGVCWFVCSVLSLPR